MPHCPVTVVQRYRDGVCSLLFHSFFIICHPYIPLHLDFLYLLYCFLVVPMHHLQYRCKKHYTCNYHFLLHYLPSLLIFFFIMQHAGIELGQHRYDATLLTSTLCCTRWSQTAHYTCARGRSRRGTLSKMASFIVDSCRDLRFSLEMWDWRRMIALGRCTPLTIVDRFGIKN